MKSSHTRSRKIKKIPLAFRILRWWFPRIEKIWPSLAGKWAARLFFRPIRFPMPDREVPALNSARRHSEVVEGKEIAFYEWGEGQPVLLVHGWSGRATQFWKFIESFQQAGLQPVSFDAPAHGHSTGNESNVMEFASVIKVLLNRYRTDTVIGHSLGGVAALLAIKNGLPIKNVMMIGSPALEKELLDEFLDRIKGGEAARMGVKDKIRKMTGKEMEAYMASRLLEDIRGINLEIIHDYHDREVGMEHALAIKENYPDAKLKKTRGFGHNRILMEAEVIDHALKFVKDNMEYTINHS